MDTPATMRRKSTSRSVHTPSWRASSSAWTGASWSRGSLVIGSGIAASGQTELARERREMPLEVRGRPLGERRGPPARRIVLVDDHGAHSLIKVRPAHDPRHDAELGAHALVERPLRPAPHLRKRDLEAERRLAADGCGQG